MFIIPYGSNKHKDVAIVAMRKSVEFDNKFDVGVKWMEE